MSATTFLLILAVVVLVFLGFVIKSWGALSKAVPEKKPDNDPHQDDTD